MLTGPLFDPDKNITANNWFTQLVTKLKQKKKLSCVSTIRKNRKELLKEFMTTKDRAQYSNNFGFSTVGNTLVSTSQEKTKISSL